MWLCVGSYVYFKDEEQPFPFISSSGAVFKGTSLLCLGVNDQRKRLEAQLDRLMHIHAITVHTGPAIVGVLASLIVAILISGQDISVFLTCFLKISLLYNT